MRKSTSTVSKIIGFGGLGALAGIACLPTTPARAQTTNFSFQSGYQTNGPNNGWLPTLNANGTSTETTAYSFLDATSTSPNYTTSTTSPLYRTADSGGTPFNGRNVTENAAQPGAGGTVRIAQGGFYVPTGEVVKLTSITFFVYVVNDPLATGSTTNYVNPFTAGHIAIYNNFPNQGAGASVVSGDGTFTTNYLTTTKTTNPTLPVYAYRENGTTVDQTRPILALTLDLSSTAPLAGGSEYFFATSFNVDHSIVGSTGSTLGDAFSVIATQTDNTFGQPNTLNGGATNGDAEVYRTIDGKFNTDQPDKTNNPNLLDAFPFLFTGAVTALPEQDSVGLLLFALPILGGLAYRRKRRLSVSNS